LNLSASLLPSIERKVAWLSSLLFAPGKVGVHVILINRETSSFSGKVGTRGIIIRLLEPQSVASNLISV
jgi:hypothetical protein